MRAPVFESMKTLKALFGVEIGGWQGVIFGVGKGNLGSKKGVLGSKKVIWGQNGVIKAQIRSFWAKIGKKPMCGDRRSPHIGFFFTPILTPKRECAEKSLIFQNENALNALPPQKWEIAECTAPQKWECAECTATRKVECTVQALDR